MSRIIYINMFFMLLLAACADSVYENETLVDNGDVIVSASIKEQAASRAPEEGGDGTIYVKNGEYTWTLDYKNSYMCQFVNGEGRIYSGNGSRPLQWTIFEQAGPYCFWLDNVIEKENTKIQDEKDTWKSVFIGPVWTAEQKKRYRAAQDTGMGEDLVSCDIVWDSTYVYKNQKAYFDLTHRMARTDVVLTDVRDYKDKPVTVKLTNLVLEPAAFNRINGEVLLKSPLNDAESLTHEDLVLLNGEKLTVTEGTDGKFVGRTPAFILPPQSAHDGTNECFLKVTIDGITYAAPLPKLMVHTPENVSDNTSFLQGLHVEIRAHIYTDEENPRIEFGPVYVKEWDDLGDYYVQGLPGGIASIDDLNELIGLYNGMPDMTGYSLSNKFDVELLNSEYKAQFRKLTRFGRHTYTQQGYGGKMYWNFKLRDDISISSADLEKFNYIYFNSCYPFNIDFDGHKMIIDGTEYTSFNDEVKSLLTDKPSADEMFKSIIEQYNKLIDLRKQDFAPLPGKYDEAVVFYWCEENDDAYIKLKSYGATCRWNKEEGKLYWTFKLTQNTVLPEGFTKFDYDYYRNLYPFTIDFNGFELKIGDISYTQLTSDEVESLLVEDGELSYIIKQYNDLLDLEKFGNLTNYTSQDVLSYLDIYSPSYKELVSFNNVTCEWKQNEGKLYWTLKLTHNTTLNDEATKFRGDFYEKYYPVIIDFNGYTINGKNNFDELKESLISNP